MVTSDKNSSIGNKYSVFFGLGYRFCDSEGNWHLSFVWRRVFVLVLVLGVLSYAAFTLGLYFFIKNYRDYSEMTLADAVKLPFQRKAFREKMGDYNIAQAKEFFRNGKFRDGYMSLVSGCARNPKNLDGIRLLAEIYLVSFRRADRAIETLEHSLPYGVNDIGYVRLYIKILMDRAEDERLVGVAKKLLSMKSVTSIEVRLYLAMALSTIHAYHGDYDLSKKYIQDFNLSKTLPGILRLSKNQWEQGDRDGAIRILAENISYPENKEAIYALLVNYYVSMKDYETARRYSMLRSLENPFSKGQRMEYLGLLRKTGEVEAMKRDMELFFNEYNNDDRSMLYFANFLADIGDLKFMRRVYDNAVKKEFPIVPYCLLLLETTIDQGHYKEAVAFIEEMMRTKPVWRTRHEEVILCLRAVAYYAVGNTNMSGVIIGDVLKKSDVSENVLVSTARMFESLGARSTALKLLERAVALYPTSQIALTRLIQLELRMGISADMNKHIMNLLKMRRPPRELIADARKSICSDRFIFIAERDAIIKEIDYLMNKKSSVFTDSSQPNNNLQNLDKGLDF